MEMELREVAKELLEILNKNEVSGTAIPFIGEVLAAHLCGCYEPLYATVLNVGGDRGVLLSWGATFDWTRALLIPEDNFEHDADEDVSYRVLEALEWFFHY